VSNYFQKIASRSGIFEPAYNLTTQNILPDKPVFLNEKQNDLIEENNQQSNFITNTPDITQQAIANLNFKPIETNSNKDLTQPIRQDKNISVRGEAQKTSVLQPNTEVFPEVKTKSSLEAVKEEIKEVKKNMTSLHIATINPGEKILPPPLTVMEKIARRNVQNTIVEKDYTEIKLNNESSDDKRLSNMIISGKENIRVVKEKNKNMNRLEPLITNTFNELLPQKPLQNLKERLIPVQSDSMSLAQVKKTKPENKLVIGRITVEVINQVQPTSKSKEQPVRQSVTSNTANTGFSGNNKLIFGLGQL
jgi:hypothetical protein